MQYSIGFVENTIVTVVCFAITFLMMWIAFFSKDKEMEIAWVYIPLFSPLCVLLSGLLAESLWGSHYVYIGWIIGAIMLAAFPTICLIMKQRVGMRK